MRWQIGWQGAAFAIVLFGIGVFLGSYPALGSRYTARSRSGCGRPQPFRDSPQPAGQFTFLCIRACISASATVRARSTWARLSASAMSARSTQSRIDWVRYYDSVGKQVRGYLDKASTLPPMGSVEFVIQRSDAAGGPGANFLIQWHAAAGSR